jgi:hypothetical protein
MEKTLATADFKLNRVFVCQMMREEYAIPEVLVIAQFPGRVQKVLPDLLQLSLGQTGRAS